MIVELKWNQNAQTAMQQIKDRKYPASIMSYTVISCLWRLITIKEVRNISV